MVVLPGPRDEQRNRDNVAPRSGVGLDVTMARTQVVRRIFPGDLCVGPPGAARKLPRSRPTSQDHNGVVCPGTK